MKPEPDAPTRSSPPPASVRKRLDFDRPVDRERRRGVPRDRPAGADRLEPPGLAVGRSSRTPTRRRRSPTLRRELRRVPHDARRRVRRGRPARRRSADAVTISATYLREQLPRGAGAAHPAASRVASTTRRRRAGRRLGLDPAGGVELHAGPARAGPRLGVDDAAPPRTRRARSPSCSASRTTRSPRPACSRSPTRSAPTSSRRSACPSTSSSTGTPGRGRASFLGRWRTVTV